MANSIVDLRKSSGPGTSVTGGTKGAREERSTGGDAIEWSAYEYDKRERGPYWFFLPGGIALALVILGIMINNYFLVAFVALAFTLLMVYMKREPRFINFALTKKGVVVDNRIYEYPSVKSFWIFEKPDLNELSFETEGALSPFIRIPLADTDVDEVRKYLGNFIKEKEHQDSAIDQIMRVLGI